MKNETARQCLPAARSSRNSSTGGTSRFRRIRMTCRILLMLLLLVCLPHGAEAEEKTEEQAEEQAEEGSCSLEIRYLDEAEEINGSADPVEGAAFTIWRIARTAGLDGYSRPLIPGMEVNERTDAGEIEEKVRKAYTGAFPEGGAVYEAVTGSDGTALCGNMLPGVYLVAETKAAPKHFASAPFLIMLPGTSEDGTMPVYHRTAEPKSLPAGDLLIRKNVGGNAGEKDRDFHFTVKFDYGGTFQAQEPWTCTRSDGRKGTIKSGDTFTLRGGESMLIENIPAGAKYSVTETEAGQDGYQTEMSDPDGVIRRTVKAEAVFTNTKNTPSAGSKGTRNIQTGDSFLILLAAAAILGVSVFSGKLLQRRKGGEK